MPDGDIFRTRLCRYQKPYQALCEGASDDAECADLFLEALRANISSSGEFPIRLAREIGNVVSAELACGAPNWARLSSEFDSLARELGGGTHYCKELVLRAAKRLRYETELSADNASRLMLQGYLREAYDAGFKGRIPLDGHHAGISDEAFTQRMSAVEPIVLEGIRGWADKLDRFEQVKKLRMPPRSRKEIDLDEDLLSA